MAVWKPFQALRPAGEMAHKIAALPYDVVDRHEARAIGEKNPDSFLHVDRAEMDLEEGIDIYDPQVYKKAAQNLADMEARGDLVQDQGLFYYIYELEREGRVQTGLAGCAGIDDYLQNVVKKHELTREDKEQDRIRHVDACNANTGPIYLAARYPAELKRHLAVWKEQHPAAYDFLAEDQISHRVWVIDDPDEVAWIENAFEDIPALYIADGHHRAASAVKVGLKRREEHPGYTGQEDFNFFLSVVFPFDELTILAYHRVVQDLKGLTVESFLECLKQHFWITPMPDTYQGPSQKHSFGCYLAGDWYELKAWPDCYEGKDVVGQLDVSILQDIVLGPLLGIGDPRTDSRIRFVGGSHSLEDLARGADHFPDGVAFALYPTAMEDLMSIADQALLMPPKSTWFEPKLRSGLFIHKL